MRRAGAGGRHLAATRTRSTRALAWPALALAGVVLPTQPWHGHINPAGLVLAELAAIGWAAFILLTQKIGDRFTGIQGLSLTVPIAALPGVPQAAGHLTADVLAAAAGLALLLPVLPYAFEMLALRHMRPAAFGTLMALDPAISVLLVLHQQPSPAQLAGILLVVLAGTRRPARRLTPPARPRPNMPTSAASSTSSAGPAAQLPLQRALTDRFHTRPESSAEATTTSATPEI
jgi:inner membrane transporter RhtA